MAILAECPMCHRRQSIRSKRCMSKNGKGCGADLEKAKRSGKVKYWIAYRLPGGKQRFEKLTGERSTSIEYAKDAEAKRKVQRRENRIFDIKPESKMTFQELTDWYLALEKVKALASYSTIQVYLGKFNSEFGNVIVSQIKAADLENHQTKRKAEGLADATVDHEIGAAKGVIYKAFKNDIVSGDTLRAFQNVEDLLKGNSNARERVLSPEEFSRLAANAVPHLGAILWAGYDTGMREGEVLGLTWAKVSLKDRIIRLKAEDTKDHEPREIPICDELFEIINGLPRGIKDDYPVFGYKGKPIKDIRSALIDACNKAGIIYGRFKEGGFIYHDLRRTFSTDARKAGVPESVIKEITGHSRGEVFDRYNQVNMDDMRQTVEKTVRYRRARLLSGKKVDFRKEAASVDQNVDQKPNSVKGAHN